MCPEEEIYVQTVTGLNTRLCRFFPKLHQIAHKCRIISIASSRPVIFEQNQIERMPQIENGNMECTPFGCESDLKTGASASPTKKTVSFATTKQVQEVPHLKDISEDQKRATWYSPDEVHAIKKALIASPTKKTVSFSTTVDVQEVPRLKDISEDQKTATWYTADEFNVIKQSLIATLRLMIAKKPIGADNCIRGLENRTPAAVKLRKKNRIDALSAVWHEQVAQWKENKINEKAISLAYQRQSYKSRREAYRMAKYDAKAAKSYLHGHEAQATKLQLKGINRKQVITSGIQQVLKKPRRSSCAPAAA